MYVMKFLGYYTAVLFRSAIPLGKLSENGIVRTPRRKKKTLSVLAMERHKVFYIFGILFFCNLTCVNQQSVMENFKTD